MDIASQRQISLGGARMEDFDGDVHYCGRCQIQFSTMYAFINHRTQHCHLVARSSQDAHININAVSSLLSAGSEATDLILQNGVCLVQYSLLASSIGNFKMRGGLLMWSVCWSVTRSRSVRWSADVVCLLVCHQVCEVVR